MSDLRTSAMSACQSIGQFPEVVNYFSGIFVKVGVSVEDTGEKFTATHEGTRITCASGIDPKVDYVLPVRLENISNLVNNTKNGKIDNQESLRIIKVLFTPMTRATLQSPMMKNQLALKLVGVATTMHVHLIQDDGSDALTHTLKYENGVWQVMEGLQGEAQRSFKLNVTQAIDYQRHVTQAVRRNSMMGWFSFALWYRKWERIVS
jgi:hypothetical protein